MRRMYDVFAQSLFLPFSYTLSRVIHSTYIWCACMCSTYTYLANFPIPIEWKLQSIVWFWKKALLPPRLRVSERWCIMASKEVPDRPFDFSTCLFHVIFGGHTLNKYYRVRNMYRKIILNLLFLRRNHAENTSLVKKSGQVSYRTWCWSFEGEVGARQGVKVHIFFFSNCFSQILWFASLRS